MEQEDTKEKKSTRFIYVRDNKGFPIGCIAYKLDNFAEAAVMAYGFSLWNPKDKFNKRVAKQCAEGRLLKRPSKISETRFHSMRPAHPNDMLRLVCEDISAQRHMPWVAEDGSLIEVPNKFRKGAARLAQKLEAAGRAHQKVA